MKFVILGAGALGTIIAAYLARSGEDVTLIARGARAKDLVAHGVTVTGLDDFTTAIEIADDPALVTSADVLILAVKTYDTAAAIASVSHMAVGSVFSIQNGVMKNDQLAADFGQDRVLGSICMIGGAILPDGRANYIMGNATLIGELSGDASARTDDIVRCFTGAKLNSAVADNILSEEWTKFVGWLGLSALAVLTRQETWKFLADENSARIAARIVREAAQLPQHLGIPLKAGGAFSLDIITTIGEEGATALLVERGEAQRAIAPDFRQSMLQDVDKGKQFEVEETFGYIVQQAKTHGLAVPTIETCYGILAGLNRIQG
jgi:2-dehydropantoate 2-reductase